MINVHELMESVAPRIAMLREGVETHNGWLLQKALRGLKDAGIVVKHANYTADGVEAELYYPFDRKSYRLTLQEDRHSK